MVIASEQIFKAHKLLAEVLYRIGALAAAKQHLDTLREIAPGEFPQEEITFLRDMMSIRFDEEGAAATPNGGGEHTKLFDLRR